MLDTEFAIVNLTSPADDSHDGSCGFGYTAIDNDSDGVPNFRDHDDDNDGILDVDDIVPTVEHRTAEDIRIGYVPNSRSLSSDNGYTLNGNWMTSSTVPNLLRTTNFGAAGTLDTGINIVAIDTHPITESAIEALNHDTLFIDSFANGQANDTFINTDFD